MAQAEDIISSYVDRTGIEQDTEFMLKNLNDVLSLLKKVQSTKVTLDASKSFKDAAEATKQLKKEQEDLEAVQAKIAEATKKRIQLETEHARVTSESFRKVTQANTDLANSYDELLRASARNQAASKELTAQAAELAKARKAGLLTEEEYIQKLAEVKGKQNEISVSNIDLNRSIRNIEKGFQSVGGSTNALRAELNLSLQAIDRLSEEEKKSDIGVSLKKKIDDLTEAITKEEQATGRFQRNVGNYNASAKTIVGALDQIEQKITDLKEKQQQYQNFADRNPIGFKTSQQASELNQVNALLATTEKEAEALRTITSDPRFFNIANVGSAKTEIRGFTTTLIELEQKGLGRTDFANELRKHLAELTDQVSDTREEIKAMSSDSRSFDQINASVKFLTSSYQTLVGVQALYGDQNEDVQKTMTKLLAVQAVANGLQDVAQSLTTRGTIVNKAYAYVQGLVAIATDASAAASTRLNAALKLSTIGLVIGAVALVISKYQEWFGTSQKVLDQQKAIDDFNEKIASSYVQQKQTLDGLVDKLKDETVSLAEKKKIVKELQDQYPNYLGNLRIEKGEVVGLTEGYNKLVQAIILKSRSQAAGELLAEQEKELLKQGLQLGVTSFEQADKLYQKYKDTKGVVSGIFLSAYENAIATRKELLKIKADADAAIGKLGGDPTGGVKPVKIETKPVDKSQVEKDLKAIFDVYKVQKEREAELLKEIVDDDKRSLADRVSAAALYVETKQKLIEDEAEFEKTLNKSTAAESQLIDKKASIERIKVAEDMEKKLIEISDRLKTQAKNNIDIFAGAVPDSSTFTEINKKLDEYKKKQELIAQTEKQLASERKQRLSDLVNQLKETLLSLATASLDTQSQAIDRQIERLDTLKAKDIDTVNQTIINQDEKEKQLAAIENRSAAQKEQLEKRKQQIEVRKAKFERDAALLSIAIDTAKEVFKIKAQAAVLLANPVTAPYAPVALAQIPLVLVSGALAAAAVLAKPLPKYKEGKNVDNYEGYAWVGDGGKSELIVREDGRMEVTPNTPTLTHVKKNDIIMPDANILWKSSKSATDRALGFNQPTISDSGLNKDQYMQGIKRLEKAILKNGRPKIIIPSPLDNWMNSGKSWDNF